VLPFCRAETASVHLAARDWAGSWPAMPSSTEANGWANRRQSRHVIRSTATSALSPAGYSSASGSRRRQAAHR
jgi:hypothetical protein